MKVDLIVGKRGLWANDGEVWGKYELKKKVLYRGRRG